MQDITVIIVSWNVRELLAECLASLTRQRGVTTQVIVVDNASADESARMVKESFPGVLCIANASNRGFAAANNQALDQATGRNILLLNPDTVVPDGAIAATVRYLDAHPDVGVMGARITNPDGTLQRSVRRDPTLLSQALVLLKLHAVYPNLPALQSYWYADFSYDHEQDVPQVMGAFLAFPRAVVRAIGYLDERFFLWFEEVDFCKRVRSAGFRIRYVPSVDVIHVGGKSFSQLLNVRQQLIFNRSLLRYVRKHHSIAGFFAIALLTPVSIILAIAEPIIRRWYAPKSLR